MLSRPLLFVAATFACALAQAAPPPVAKVLFAEGKPVVVSQGRRSPAAAGRELAREDQLDVPVASWLVLQVLRNGYVVKIDEDLVMDVRDIALLDASTKAPSLEDQLNAMVRAREISQDRVTGFQNRKVAGEGMLAGRQKRAALDEDSAPAPSAMEDEAKAAPAPPPPAPEAAPAPMRAASAPPPGGGGGGGLAAPQARSKALAKPSLAKKERALKDVAAPRLAWATVRGGRLEPQSAALDGQIAQILEQPDVAACIAGAWKVAGLAAPKADHLLLRRATDGKAKVRLASRLPLPADCATALEGRLAAVTGKLPDQGWIRVQIALAAP